LQQPVAFGESWYSELLTIAELAAALRGTSELALETGQQGIAFLGAVRKAWPHLELDRIAGLLHDAAIAPVLPVAAGIACAVHGINLDLALPLYVQGSATNVVSAAVRLVPLGQTDGLIALAALEDAVLDTASEATSAGPDDIGSAAFMVDLASMRHETQYTRLFRS
jgi:urease accessory protein